MKDYLEKYYFDENQMLSKADITFDTLEKLQEYQCIPGFSYFFEGTKFYHPSVLEAILYAIKQLKTQSIHAL